MDPQTAPAIPETVVIPESIIARILDLQGKPPNPFGRPTVMTNNILHLLKEAFLMDCTDLEACQYAGIGKSTLYNYQNANPDFLEQKELWKQDPFLKARKTLKTALEFDSEIALKYMERKKKAEFALRTEITGADGDAIEMTLDKLENNKTDYGTVADKARAAMDASGAPEGQVVAANPLVQNQG